jgi:mycothiol synthase
MATSKHLTALQFLDESQRIAIGKLVVDATRADGVPPLSEHVSLHLRDGGDAEDLHFLAYLDDQLAGYAHLDLTDHVDGPSAELVVHPGLRGQGVGRRLMADVVALAGPRLRLWSHGDLPVAADLAQALGFQRIRTVIQMRRSLTLFLPRTGDQPKVRPFVVGQDEAAWLEVNAQAFVEHPEQGQWTAEDLQRRLTESWFNPEGFLLHERNGEIAAFCWTKVHGRQVHAGHSHDPIGEIYVVGVNPNYHGQGLGRALTVAGLAHLQSVDVQAAMLYVDATNTRAISMYRALGFSEWGRDVMYRAKPPSE